MWESLELQGTDPGRSQNVAEGGAQGSGCWVTDEGSPPASCVTTAGKQ